MVQRFGPGQERLGVERRVAAGLQLLAQVEVRCELQHGALTLADGSGRRRLQQPAGEGRPSHRCGGRVQQVHDRGVPEDIEVQRVQMRGVGSFGVAQRDAAPVAVHSLEGDLVGDLQADGTVPPPTDLLMMSNEQDEGDAENHPGGDTQRRGLQDPPDEARRAGGKRDQPQVGEAIEARGPRLGFPPIGLDALGVDRLRSPGFDGHMSDCNGR